MHPRSLPIFDLSALEALLANVNLENDTVDNLRLENWQGYIVFNELDTNGRGNTMIGRRDD